MREVAWIAFHIVIALPVALIFSVVLREALRALLALAIGFRVFEIRIGVGQSLFAEPVGPIDFSLAALPLGGATIAASADAKRHRSRRFALAVAPLLAQLVWLLWTVGPASAGLSPIQSGFAPITVLVIAQIALFALHLFLPIRWGTDEETDLRTLLDVVLGTPSTHRRTRAAYYARAVRHAIERGQIESAHASLQKGLTQLGPEPLLVECQTILATRELTSVIDQGESAEALLILLEWTPPDEDDSRSPIYSFQRLGRHGVYALPLLGAIAAYAAFHHDAIASVLTERWIESGAAIVETASAEACASHRVQAESWPRSLAPSATPAMRRDHHYLTAQLLACEGALGAAEEAAEASLALAEEARATHYVGAIQNPQLWIEDELRLAAVLSFQGELTLQRGTFRIALQTLMRADRELTLVREQLDQATGETERNALVQLIDVQQERILDQRFRIQTEMAAR